jgi:anti-sigma factor RsiW
MNCLQAEENFSAHFEDALDYETLQRFESHIAECTTCQHEYAQFQDSVTASQRLPQIEPSPYFETTLQQRLSEEQRETFSFWQRLQHVQRAEMGTQRSNCLDFGSLWNLFIPR